MEDPDLTYEGLWDRFKTGIKGASTSVKNVAANIGDISKGEVPDSKNLKNVTTDKIDYRFGLAKTRLSPLLKQINIDLSKTPDFDLDYDDLISKKPEIQVKINKEILDFINDLSKDLKMRPREVINVLHANHSDIYKMLAKLHNFSKISKQASGIKPKTPVAIKSMPSMGSMATVPYKPSVLKNNTSQQLNGKWYFVRNGYWVDDQNKTIKNNRLNNALNALYKKTHPE
jgi:hypothetical protein